MENNTRVKLRFLNCEEFCLQQGDSLTKISNDVLEVRADAPVVYLLTMKGDIKCTIITDKQEYENQNNIDRRTLNVANHFNVLWEDDGQSCTVYYQDGKKDGSGKGCLKIGGIILLILFLVCGVLVFIGLTVKPESSDFVDSDTVVYVEEIVPDDSAPETAMPVIDAEYQDSAAPAWAEPEPAVAECQAPEDEVWAEPAAPAAENNESLQK